MEARQAESTEIAALARVWCDGWHDAHKMIVPAALVAMRTIDQFERRMAEALPKVRVIGRVGAPLGFYFLKHDELDQFYIGAQARGTGTAALLLRDAEARLLGAGVTNAWLACAVGNLRAARFYEKSGWVRTGGVTAELAAPGGTFPLKVWRYEKTLTV